MLIEPPEDGADHQGRGSRGAVLAGDISLLGQSSSHVIHYRHYDADVLLGYRQPLGQLEKEEHLGLKHHSNGSWRGNGRSAGWDGQTELHIPIQLGRLVWEQLQFHDANTVSEYVGWSSQQLCKGI